MTGRTGQVRYRELLGETHEPWIKNDTYYGHKMNHPSFHKRVCSPRRKSSKKPKWH